ncbi:MAG TPA: hypothetical protein VGQ26_05685 [Streptosporangiaceae bacterium]|jgi:hypothetical protein|nr:hypothetical protein [Streptosporangiaceae bacterium]
MSGRPHRRRQGPAAEHRADWWRGEIATAATPAEQYHHVHRWLHAVTRRADQLDRDAAFTSAARAVAAVAAELERKTARPGATEGPQDD